MNTKTRYYRHNDPRRGFRLCQQFQIANYQKLLFRQDIQKINQMYKRCANSHSYAFLSQPNQNQTLKNIFLLLIFPVIVCFLYENYQYLAHLYFLCTLGIVFLLILYMRKINFCRNKFNEANQLMRSQFYALQNQFEEKWPKYSLALMREWNQFNETCIQYIEIFRKEEQIQAITQEQNKENFKQTDEGQKSVS